jgi:hypothetical protein
MRRNASLDGVRFRLVPFPIIHGRVLPHREAAPAGASLEFGIRADRGAADFSNTPSAGRQRRTKMKRKHRKDHYAKQSQNIRGVQIRQP